MVDWTRLSLALLGIGFELDVLAIAIYRFTGSDGAIEAMNICGFICYTVALLLLLMIVFGVTPASRAAKIAKICFSFAACAFVIIGVAIFAARVNSKPDPYAMTLLVTSAIMALLSGIFCLLTVAGCRC
ncbi:hypothetical protein CAPTEDRAFT_199734 [Capitella teleta]|uniref:MARVEL domain-containing protein n=1 Tax=Capitella teleta TaxID=283909 RepID=R7V9G4_CAPTE|nr:hypothetical protein CAPTEDRAFT_199734 [Capitella teleta]|eukprot:ELU13001.1 hypothetical protein CAPTEDRAFT_199734 [Capitella teleta]